MTAASRSASTWRRDMIFGPGMVFSPFAQVRGDIFHVETAPDDYETFGRGAWPRRRRDQLAVHASGRALRPDRRAGGDGGLRQRRRRRPAHRQRRQPRVRTRRLQPLPPERRAQLRSLGARRARQRRRARDGARAHRRKRLAHVRPPLARGAGRRLHRPRTIWAARASDWVAGVQADLGSGFGAEARFRLDDETLRSSAHRFGRAGVSRPLQRRQRAISASTRSADPIRPTRTRKLRPMWASNWRAAGACSLA